MGESPKQHQPFRRLGLRLRHLRERLHQSLAEVSGAVEIEPDLLARFERGERCPSEEVLLLLFSYFNTEEDEAVRLWEMAGYDQQEMPQSYGSAAGPNHDEAQVGKPIVMVMQQDTRILYTDMVNVNVNNHGVVMNFMQKQGVPDGQPNVVARIGMSREHAESVLNVLQQTLHQSKIQNQPKSLPMPQEAPEATED